MALSKSSYLLIFAGLWLLAVLFMGLMIALGNQLYFRKICEGLNHVDRDRKLKDLLAVLSIRNPAFTPLSRIFEGLLGIFFVAFVITFRFLDPDSWLTITSRLLFSFVLACILKGIISISTVYPSPFFKSCQTLVEFSKRNLAIKVLQILIGPFQRSHSPVSSPMSIDAALATLLFMNFVSNRQSAGTCSILLVLLPAAWWAALVLGFIAVNICYTSEVIVAIMLSWFCQLIVVYSVVRSMKAKKQEQTTWLSNFVLESCQLPGDEDEDDEDNPV